jgi:hypothetical protein
MKKMKYIFNDILYEQGFPFQVPTNKQDNKVMQSYYDISSPAKLAAFIDSEMSEIGNALASMRQSIKSLHRGEISSQTLNEKATDISDKLYHTTHVIGQLRIALIRKSQAYRTQVNKILRIIRAMREISKNGENAQIDAIIVMQMQELISDAKHNLMQQKSEHVSAIRAVLNVQCANWAKFAKLTVKIDAWLKEEDDARRHCPCPDDCECQICTYTSLYGYGH